MRSDAEFPLVTGSTRGGNILKPILPAIGGSLLLGAVLLFRFGGDLTSGTSPPGDPHWEVILRDPLPSDCSPNVVKEILNAYLNAHNRGDTETMSRLVGPDFQWFSIGAGDEVVAAYNLNDLKNYLERKNRVQLTLVRLTVRDSWLPNQVALAMELQVSDDQQLVPGKGEINCNTNTVPVLSIGDIS